MISIDTHNGQPYVENLDELTSGMLRRLAADLYAWKLKRQNVDAFAGAADLPREELIALLEEQGAERPMRINLISERATQRAVRRERAASQGRLHELALYKTLRRPVGARR